MAGSRARVVEDRGVFGDLLIDLELRLEALHLVVHVDVGLPLDPSRPPGQDDERRLLGVRARDGVDHVEAAGAVGHAADAEAAGHASRAVGGEPDGGLVAQPDQPETAVVFERFVEVEDEVPGDAEDVPDTVVPQLVEEKLVEPHRLAVRPCAVIALRRIAAAWGNSFFAFAKKTPSATSSGVHPSFVLSSTRAP